MDLDPCRFNGATGPRARDLSFALPKHRAEGERARGRTSFPRFTYAALIGLLSLTACTEDPAEPTPIDPAQEVRDDLAELPPTPEDDLVLEYLVDERIVPPGTEEQVCYFLEPEKEDLWLNALESYQGEFGHHLVLFTATVPETPGTVRDCTKIEDMINLLPAISSVNFGLEEFPDGMAIKVAKGSQLVVQQHTVNTTERPIRVRDGLHLRLLEPEDVTIPAGFYGVSEIDFSLPPDAESEREVSFDCVAPRDMKLLLMGPHMHEWGVRFTAEVGSEGSMREIVRVDPWFAEFRDEPPVTEWGLDDPLVLHEGDIVRTTCVFRNTAGRDLEFPAEMCATYGYYFPAPEGNEAWICAGKSG